MVIIIVIVILNDETRISLTATMVTSSMGLCHTFLGTRFLWYDGMCGWLLSWQNAPPGGYALGLLLDCGVPSLDHQALIHIPDHSWGFGCFARSQKMCLHATGLFSRLTLVQRYWYWDILCYYAQLYICTHTLIIHEFDHVYSFPPSLFIIENHSLTDYKPSLSLIKRHQAWLSSN